MSDKEWSYFYKSFITPFEECVGDQSGLLDDTKLKACLAKPELELFGTTVDKSMDIIKGLDRESDLTFYDYVFLRRINKGMTKCGDNGYL